MTPTDYFTPYNTASLDGADTDVGSGGVLIPADQTGTYPHELIQSGKQGHIYVLNRDTMTNNNSHYCNGCTTDSEILQTVTGITGLWSMPAYWNGNVYFWGNGDSLKAYTFTGGVLSASPTSQSAETSGFPGSTPVVSANGTTDGIVWAVESDGYLNSPRDSSRLQRAERFAAFVRIESDGRTGHSWTGGEIHAADGGKRQGVRRNLQPARCIRIVREFADGCCADVHAIARIVYHFADSDHQRHYNRRDDLLHDGRQHANLIVREILNRDPGQFVDDDQRHRGRQRLFEQPSRHRGIQIAGQTEPPVLSPAGGSYTAAQSVTLTDASPTDHLLHDERDDTDAQLGGLFGRDFRQCDLDDHGNRFVGRTG